MDNQFWLGLIGILIVIFQAIQVILQRTQNIYVKWQNERIEKAMDEIKKLWGRVNTHGHWIECTDRDCKPRTVGIDLNMHE